MHGLEVRGALVDRGRFHEPGRFGRMFSHLRSLRSFEPGPEALGRAGGPMDGGADATPNEELTAGFTFLGQFLDHDITFDPTSSLERQNDPEAVRNFRTPAFELDSVYGAGPSAQPYLYDADIPGAFAIARRSEGEESWDDLPRAPGSSNPGERGPRETAIIGDPRNDENLIVSQIHLAFMKFHNAVLGSAEVQALPPPARFEEAQRIVRWHYQWIVLNEFLAKTCGPELVDEIRSEGRQFFQFDGEAYMPVEFSVAAYRFGHSQVRPGYRINAAGGAAIFPAGGAGNDLRGNRKLPRDLVIDWNLFFGPTAQAGMRIDTKLAGPLLNLPTTVVPEQPQLDPATGQPILTAEGRTVDTAKRSLAERNLQRGITFNLPSGQAVARYMAPAGIAPLSDSEIWEGVPGGRGPAPLWYYILREAELRGEGRRLHGVGARIVAEVFIGLLEGDLASYLNQDPGWMPTLPASPGVFGIADLLRFAGVMTTPAPAGGGG